MNDKNLIQSDMDIAKAFAEAQNKNEMAEVLKELFDEKKILLIGDLSKDECKLCTRIYVISEMKKIPVMKNALYLYMKLLISQDRKSRRELLEAIRGYAPAQSMFQRFGNMFRRDRGGL